MIHPARKHILYRWILALALVLGAGAFVFFVGFASLFPDSPRPPREEEVEYTIPSDRDARVLEAAVELMESLDEHQASFTPAPPNGALVRSRTSELSQAPAQPDLSLIFLSPRGNAAIIDNEPYEEGGVLPDGRRVEAITKQGVVLELDGDRELLPWIDPAQVSITDVTRTDSIAPQQLPATSAQDNDASTPAPDQTTDPNE